MSVGPGRPPTPDQVARERLAERNGHQSVEGRAVDAAAIADTAVDQPAAKRTASEGRGDTDEAPSLRGIHRRTEFVEQGDVVGNDLAVTGQQRRHVALGDIVHQGKQLTADTDPAKARVIVHRVTEGFQTKFRAQGDGVAAPKPEKGSLTATGTGPGHRGDAVETGAPEQMQNHGLGEVIGGVARGHVNRKNGVASVAGPFLEVRANPDLDGVGNEANAEPLRQGLHRVRLHGGSCPQTVIDVMEHDRRMSGADSEHGKGDRIGSTRDGARHVARWGERTRLEEPGGQR